MCRINFGVWFINDRDFLFNSLRDLCLLRLLDRDRCEYLDSNKLFLSDLFLLESYLSRSNLLGLSFIEDARFEDCLSRLRFKWESDVLGINTLKYNYFKVNTMQIEKDFVFLINYEKKLYRRIKIKYLTIYFYLRQSGEMLDDLEI
uniref:CSON004356 protein n=1 Tax=Culicoides sonorensis TaxID=179676 RepID=A0A336LWC9_CULSO